ncbi:MAG TPA: hypothetical protein VMF88_14895 [Bacteroidota bacterium]|nr:hypothetical protein [Bacteroidota bacterium]
MRFKYLLPACFLLVFATGSCDLLKTRDPQPPSQGNTANPPAASPQILIANLQACFANKNFSDYEKIFADLSTDGRTYVFVPTQEASASYSAIFSRWTTEAELNYFRKVMASVSSGFTPTVSFTNSVTTTFLSDSALYEADYSVFITPTTYSGHVRFSTLLNKNTGTWVLDRWEDLQSSNSAALTWSDLKGQFSQ